MQCCSAFLKVSGKIDRRRSNIITYILGLRAKRKRKVPPMLQGDGNIFKWANKKSWSALLDVAKSEMYLK